jgi:hypothetical protein
MAFGSGGWCWECNAFPAVHDSDRHASADHDQFPDN